jgi:hypothetical protein
MALRINIDKLSMLLHVGKNLDNYSCNLDLNLNLNLNFGQWLGLYERMNFGDD